MTTLDARLEAIRQDLLRELFLGTAEALRELLRPLNEPDRAALNATLSDMLNNLPAMFSHAAQFRFSNEFQPTGTNGGFFQTYQRNWDLNELHQKISENRSFFEDLRWIEEVDWIELNPRSPQSSELIHEMANRISGLYTRLLCLKFSVGGRKQVLAAFKLPRDVNFSPLFILQPGQMLLDRSVLWILDVLVAVAKSPRKYFVFPAPGFAKLLTEVRERFPEWNDQLEPYYAEVMHREGFSNYFTGLQKDIAPEILFAGFLADPLPSDIQGEILGPEPRKLFLELSEKGLISRAQLL